jgi:hypothetical protein
MLMFLAYAISDENDGATTYFSSVSLEDSVSDNVSFEVSNIAFMSSSQFPKYSMYQLLGFNSNLTQKSINMQSMQDMSSQDTKNATHSKLPSQNICMDTAPEMQLEMVDKEELRTFLQSSLPKSTDISHVREYVTPYADAVQDYLEDENLDGAEEIYEAAVSWIWVSDTILNGQPDAWLTPSEFLEDTPHFDSNPMPGKIVSDCSEQANTLASLFIGSGEYDENTVRVAIGERKFSGINGGHAWVEVYEGGKWFPVDAVVGPRYDANTSEIVYHDNYEDIDFYYYQEEDYYVVDVWCYYNNKYFIDTESIIGDVPDNWNSIPSSY